MDENIKDIISRIEKLEAAVFASDAATPKRHSSGGVPDFSLNERAYVKRYAPGRNGQQVFTLICAFLAKGRGDTAVERTGVVSLWERCSGVIGYPFRSIYATRAKENNWVDTSTDKRGVYTLASHWNEVTGENE